MRMKKVEGTLVTMAAVVLWAACAGLAGRVICVDRDAAGGGDGSSWNSAYNSLQDALAAARVEDQVWVAGGVYKPDQGRGKTAGDRYATFQLKSGVVVKGGYAGFGRADPNERDMRKYESILSGDLKGDDGALFANNKDNAYHVVTGSAMDQSAVLDGFTVTAGNADGDNPAWDYGGGGGMYCRGGSPTILNCMFRGNSGDLAGGLHIRDGSSPMLVNCVISGNASTMYSGGGMDNYYAGTVLVNCTLTSNTAPYAGSAMDNYYCSPRLTNCIIWGNTVKWDVVPTRRQISGGVPIVSHSCIQDADPNDGESYPGAQNTSDDPLFVDFDGADNTSGTGDDNLRLLPGSPCVDAGDNGALPASVVADLDGEERIVGGTIDMGAYEGPDQGFLLGPQAITVPEGQTGRFTVALAKDPLGSVEVSAIVASGDQDIAIAFGSRLTFDSSNYRIPQDVGVTVGEDEDYFNSTALILVSSPGFFDAGVSVREWDDEAPAVLYADRDAVGKNDGTSWKDAFVDLQAAMAVARMVAQVKEVRVAEGVYRPTGPHGDRGASFELISGVSLMGGYAGFGGADANSRDVELYTTVLSGDLNGDDVDGGDPCSLGTEPTRAENSCHVVCTTGMAECGAVLDGFTITGGNADGGGEPFYERGNGGGLIVSSYAGPEIRNCVFNRNWAEGYGGGMSGMGSLDNCRFVENVAQLGGGLNGNVTLVGCEFTNNRALANGGGMHGSGSLSRCTFSQNSATGWGGGLSYCDNAGGQTLVDCRFFGNGAAAGAGACISASSPTVANCLFSGNSATGHGGGLFANSYGCEAVLVNCTFAGNSARECGGGICGAEDSQPTAVNCIFWANTAQRGPQMGAEDGSCVLHVRYCDVQGGQAGVQTEVPHSLDWGDGNMDAEPLWVDPEGLDGIVGTKDDNLRLGAGSACIDAGMMPGGLPPSCTTDLDGNARIVHEVVDIGAYEFQGPFCVYVNGVSGSDLNNGLTAATAFATIQKGIDSAQRGMNVLVYPGLYRERLNFKGKAITVSSAGDAAVLESPGDYAVSFYSGEGADSVLKNIIIRDSYLGIFVAGASPTICNVTVVDNGFGIAAYSGASPDISNSIFWDNRDGDLFGCQARYSCVQTSRGGEYNISSDPAFADPTKGDYHLRSRRGRYAAQLGLWVLDTLDSPCIDGGDPAVAPSGEPMPNGGRVNMGAHGGTAFASMSEWLPAGDMNRDGVVDFADMAVLCEQWLVRLPWADSESGHSVSGR